MPTIEDIPVELRQQIASHLDIKSFKAFRLTNHRLCRGTFPDLLKRGSRNKHIRFTVADLEKAIRILEHEMFVENIDTIFFDSRRFELPWSQHWLTLWTLLAKIRSIHATGKSINVEVFDKYSSRRHKKKLGTLLRREIDNLGGGIHYIVATENHNLRTGAGSDDFSFFSRRYRIGIDHNIATPRKKQTLIWDPGNERLTILHADETLLSLIMPCLSRTGMTFVKDLRIYHSTLRLDDINALTENVTKVILEDVDIVMLPFSKPRCRWRSVLYGLIQRSEKGLLPSCQLSQLRRSWVSQNRHNRTAPDKEDDTVMEGFTANTSAGVQAGLEAIVREDVLDNQQN